MRVLLDSGVLLRLPNRTDVLHAKVRDAVRSLRAVPHLLDVLSERRRVLERLHSPGL